MDDDFKNFIASREERITFGGKKLVVRELELASDSQEIKDKKDATFILLVQCVFNEEDGAPFFSMDDVPLIKKASQTKMIPLISALHRVMGYDIGEEVKNSDAAPSGG